MPGSLLASIGGSLLPSAEGTSLPNSFGLFALPLRITSLCISNILRADATISSHRSDRIVPGGQSRMSFEGKTADLPWVGRCAGWILASVKVRRDCQSGSGAGVADEIEDFGVAVKGLGGPVLRDFGEQPVLDGIPFGSPGRVMSHGYGEPKGVAELALQFGFPGAGTAAVAAAGVGQDQQL